MLSCQYTLIDGHLCDAPCEGRTNYCGSHNRIIRREVEANLKAIEKRYKVVSKPKKIYKAPNKVSEKRKLINEEYFKLVEQFKKDNPNCKAKINEYCTEKTDDPHHSRGRGVYLLDVTTWVSVCRSCHRYIEQNPLDAHKRGLSFSRLAKDETI